LRKSAEEEEKRYQAHFQMDEKKFEEKIYVLELLCENKELTMSLHLDHKTYRECITARTSLAAT
jgi:hypothetical protein